MMLIRITQFGLVLLISLSCCCSPEPPAGDEQAAPISLVPLTFDEWQSKIEEYRGEIVVVDMWATWCAPCVERFPHMVELYGTYKSRGVRFVSMCLDDREDKLAVEHALEFLKLKNATFDNYLMNENITDAFEKLDLLGIPAVFVYNRAGELRYRLTGDDPNNQFTDEDVENAIRELLRS